MPVVTMPKTLMGMNKSEKSILNKLKQLYLAEPCIAYLYLEPKIQYLQPDFILIDPLRGVIIIEVKAWSIDYIDTINDKEIISVKGNTLENPLAKARRYYNTLQNVFRSQKALFDHNNQLKIRLNSVIIFSELKEQEATDAHIIRFFNHYPARAVYKNQLNTLSLEKLFIKSIMIDDTLINSIRVAIFPELKLSGRTATAKHALAHEDILALDIEQERFAKSLPLGHYIITGIPGSGKTVALIARAIYLARLYPTWNILILTYNKTLSSQLENKIQSIKADLQHIEVSIHNIEIATFHQKAMGLSSLSPTNFKDKDAFWREDLPNDALKHAQATYHAILVDEYQDFHSHWFTLILKLLIIHTEEAKSYHNLFLAGDRLQGIYNPKEINWKQDIGLDMRGKAKLLKTSYRSTQEQVKFGLALLSNDKKYKNEIALFYEGAEGILFRNKTQNSIKIVEDTYDGIATLFQELLKTYHYRDILLLAPSRYIIKTIKEKLPSTLQKNILSNKDASMDKSLFTTYHSSKGIEAKIAIVVDIQQITQRKLFYVTATRSSIQLILHIAPHTNKGTFVKEVYDLL